MSLAKAKLLVAIAHNRQQCKLLTDRVRLEVFTATMKNAVFWDMTPCGSWESRSEERVSSVFRVETISGLGTML
jgi:hypothetical protein